MSWSALSAYLRANGGPRVVLSFQDIERIIGQPLPASARLYRPFWANSNLSIYSRHWMSAGYKTTSVGVPSGSMAFDRVRAEVPAEVANPAPQRHAPAKAAASLAIPTEAIALVGCVKTKVDHPAAAKDLYISDQFRKRRAYAETLGDRWFILSARHGLVDPDELLEPYDVALAHQSASYRAAWGEWVAARLEAELGSLSGQRFTILAGAAYADAISGPLIRRGAELARPLEGLRQGEQLAWLNAVGTVPQPPATTPELMAYPTTAEEVANILGEASNAVPTTVFLQGQRSSFAVPGMYSWWVDTDGAGDLTAGLGHTIARGLVYAGQAGATRRLSGKPSTNTLWVGS